MDCQMQHDIVIIGAGVTGVARHTSGRNSGVVHAGFNPKPGTLKARFWLSQARMHRREVCEQ